MKERACLSSSWTPQALGQRPCEKASVLTLKISTVLSFLIKADVTLSRLCIRHDGFLSPPLTQRVVCSLPHQPLPGRRPPPGPSHVPSGLTTACPRPQLLDYIHQEAFHEARTPGGGCSPSLGASTPCTPLSFLLTPKGSPRLLESPLELATKHQTQWLASSRCSADVFVSE